MLLVAGCFLVGGAWFGLPLQAARAASQLVEISQDPLTNASSQHQTEVEPGSSSWGSTTVAAVQVGRNTGYGAAALGWATSNDDGATWQHGLLGGITQQQGGGPYPSASDPVVAYDAAHSVWLIDFLGIPGATGWPVLVTRSTSADGRSWETGFHRIALGDFDKPWLTCDDTASSRFYGHCYAEWAEPNTPPGFLLVMSVSTDGGLTWSAPAYSADGAAGFGGVPVVQTDGKVVVPYADATRGVRSFASSDGGATWDASVSIDAGAAGSPPTGLRSDLFPTDQVDGDGRVYVAWQDCTFKTVCLSNDIVMSTSTDGVQWTPLARVPIDAVTSAADHFNPALGVDRGTHAPNVRLGILYYFYPDASCSASTCQLEAGYIGSRDGGQTWTAPQVLTSTPMPLAWLADSTGQGRFFGDYETNSFTSDGTAHPMVIAASAPVAGSYREALYTATIASGAPPPTPTPIVVGPPGPPQNVIASPGVGQATVSWSAPLNDGGAPVTAYALYVYPPIPAGELVTTNPSSTVVTGLSSSTYYTFTLTAWNGTRWGAWSAWSPWVWVK